METLLRNAFLFLAKNRAANRAAQTYGLRFGASRFVAGETIATAIEKVKEFNARGILVTLDHLGEFVANEREATQSADECIETLEAIAAAGVKSNLSLKMTQLGLDISVELCSKNMRRILDVAKKHGNFVRIDMEDYAHNGITLEIFNQLREEYGETIGLVIQAYLYKSAQDIEDLNKFHPNLRLVKGAYKELPEVAYPKKEDVDANYVRLIERHLALGNFAAVATHDETMIAQVKSYAAKNNIQMSQFEFQMLYGIRSDLQEKLVREGYNVRVYVPYGTDWYGYFMRRLAERPANVGFVLKSMFKG